MKKALNIISIADLSVLALWAAFLTLSKIFPETEFFSATFVIIYAIAIVTVLLHTVISVILLAKKKNCSLLLLISTYAINFVWVIVLFALINYAINIL